MATTSKESQSRKEDGDNYGAITKPSVDKEKPEEGSMDNGLENQVERLPYPKSVFFIVGNEFCERFSFYGMRTILSIYLRNKLHFTDQSATVLYHAFIMICYFFPLLGAAVADSWLGKYKTILYLSIVYAVGNVIVSTAAIPNTLPPVEFTMIGLVLVALGTGGIKPCVSAFGGDQFKLPQQEDQLKKFFSVFYFAINAGSLASTFLTPILREQVKCFGEDSCFSLAFGVPALLMIVAIVIYFLGRRFYKVKEPEGNVVVKVVKCMWHANTTKSSKNVDHWLDKAQDKYDKKFIDDIKATIRVLVLFIPLPIFWALFDQQGSRWTFQAARMNGEIGSFKIEPDQMQLFNPLLILAFIVLFNTVIYPLLEKCRIKTPLQKLTLGGLLAASSFGISALVEFNLEPTYPVLPKLGEGQLRLYNGLPSNVTIRIDGISDNQDFGIMSLDFWKNLNIPVSNQKEFEIYINGKKEDQKIFVNENSATSYAIRPSEGANPVSLLQIRNEDIDKSENGKPKVMVIYSDTESFNNKAISITDSGNGNEVYWKTVSKETPYVNYTKVMLSSDKYILKVDRVEVLKNFEMKQGGVYVILITRANEEYKANILTITKPNSLHILWTVPQYVVMTAGEVMFSVTGLEFAFTQAPVSMKSLLQAAWLLTVAVGNLVVVIIAEANIFESQAYEFLLFGGLMVLDMVIFALMAMRYKYVEHIEEENETEMEEQNKQQ